MSDIDRLTPLSPSQYVRRGGNECPYCHAENSLHAGEITADSGHAYQNVTCLLKEGGCGREFTDEYTLTGYTPAE